MYCTFFHYWQQADFFNIFVVVKVNFLRVLKSNQDIFPTFNMWTVKPPKRDFVKQAAASCKHPKFISFFVICTFPRKKNPLWCSMNWGLNLANLAYLWIWNSFQIRSRFNITVCKVWKLQNFSVTQILREIKVDEFRVSKFARLTHLVALNFDIDAFLHF